MLFAGEVFPVNVLRALKTLWQNPVYFNLYGPTETNVCTCFQVPDAISAGQRDPFPIGRPCSHCRAKVLNQRGAPATEGELYVAGPSVMQGYWNLPEESRRVFAVDDHGYSLVQNRGLGQTAGGRASVFLGRRDCMVKRRGYRIELGEIESALYRHPDVDEAAVMGLSLQEHGVELNAFLGCASKPSVIALKKFCLEQLPDYMIPDRFLFLSPLPKTATHKVDYQKLNALTR